MAGLDQAAIKGEPGTGYESPDGKGEFECANCEYFDKASSSCGQKDMMKISTQPRLPNGRVRTDPEGCCEYVSRIGRPDRDDDQGAGRIALSFRKRGNY